MGCSLPVNATVLFGRAVVGLKITHLGALADLAFARQEIGQFCTPLAIEDLVEEIKLYRSGARQAVRIRHDVESEITALKGQRYKTLLAGGNNSHFDLAKRRVISAAPLSGSTDEHALSGRTV
jgi:hypothetical protein